MSMGVLGEPPDDDDGLQSSISRAVAATGLTREQVMADDEPRGAAAVSSVVSFEQVALGPAQVWRGIVQQTGSVSGRREVWLVANGSGGFSIAVLMIP